MSKFRPCEWILMKKSQMRIVYVAWHPVLPIHSGSFILRGMTLIPGKVHPGRNTFLFLAYKIANDGAKWFGPDRLCQISI